jgi:hypothetical protein
MGLWMYFNGDVLDAALALAMIGVLLVASLAQWFLGQRGRNAGRYID